MFKLPMLLILILLTACEDKLSKIKSTLSGNVTWEQYRSDCGTDAQEKNEARSKKIFLEKYKGKEVHWQGEVESIDNDGLDSMEAYSDYQVRIKMPNSDSILADILLRFPKANEGYVLSLNKGDIIEWKGIIIKMGGVILDHSINVTGLPKGQ